MPNTVLQQDHPGSPPLRQPRSHSPQVRPGSQGIHNEGSGAKCQMRDTHSFQVVTDPQCKTLCGWGKDYVLGKTLEGNHVQSSSIQEKRKPQHRSSFSI